MEEAVNSGRSVLALQIIEQAGDAFFAVDAQYRVTFANPAAERLLGMKEAALAGRPLWGAFAAADGSAFETACRSAMDERVTVSLESFQEPLQKWYDIQATPSEDGGLLVRFRDITERKRAEEAVRAERQRFRDVLDQLPAYLVLLSPDYHVSFANRFFRERFGESAGQRCYEYLFQRTEPCEICDTYTVLKTGAPHRWEWTGPDKHNYDIYDFPFVDADGSKLIMEVGLDITERKQAEAGEREVDARYRSLFNSIDAGFCVVEVKFDEAQRPLDYRFVEVNPAFERHTGLVNAQGRWMRSLAPAHEQHWFDIYGAVALTGEPVRFENPARALDDRWYDVYAFRVDKPEARRVAILFNDITESKRAEAELAKHRNHLEELVKERTNQLEAANARLQAEIAERKQVEEELRKATGELEQHVAARTEELRVASLYARSLIEASLDPLVTISPEGKITDVNQATELVTGEPRDRLIGSSFSDYFTKPQKADAGYRKVLAEGLVRDYPLTILHVSGRTTDVLYNATVYRDEAGQVQGVFAAARDVTERKRMEEELRAASLYARSLIEASLDPLVTISPEGKITDVNQATELVTGAARDRLIGSSFSDYFTEPQEADAGYQKVLAEGLLRDYPLTIRHVSGRTTDVLYNATVYRDEAGQVQGVFAAARDVTERKRMEEELRVASLYARSLLEASLDPLVTISPEGKVTDVNQATELVTGVARERLIGSNFSEYFTEPPKAEAGYQRVLAEGLVQDYPLTIRHVSGRTTDVLYNAVVYRNEAGEVQGVFAAARDVTERKRAEAELARYRDHLEELVRQRTGELEAANLHLQRMTAELARSNQELEQFAYVASHDLQEPLRAVTGYLGLLEQQFGDRLDDTGRHQVAGAVQGASRMHALITGLLVLSRVGTQGHAFEAADLNNILDQALDGLRASVTETGAIITRDPLPTLQVDALQMVQLFQNLVGNALKFRGERPPEIHVSAQEQPEQWVLAVRDNGIGIEPQYFERIFLIFQRLHTRRLYPGTGIGLAICKKIVERHGGAMSVQSQPGQGSTFYFTIPRRDIPWTRKS